MAMDIKAPIGGRSEDVQTAQTGRQAELLRSLVERSVKGPPSVRRRALALAGVRIARSIEGTQRGKA